MTSEQSLRQRLYTTIFGTTTRAGRIFDECLLVVIIASLVVVMLDSIQEVHDDYKLLFYYLEWLFTGIFGIEYLIRLYCSPKPLRYAFSFYGLIDLLAVLPGILTLFFASAQYLILVRVIRVLRVFRILKLTPYLTQANYLLVALRGSQKKITVFFACILILVIIFGGLMYVVEGPEHGFTSIPKGIYWAIVTLTTVGYGDISPQTPLGQAIASLVMIAGYSIIAVPTGIFTAEMANAMRQEFGAGLDGTKHECPNCNKSSHQPEASYCCRCGSTLYPLAADGDKQAVD